MSAAPNDESDAAGLRRALRSRLAAIGGPLQILAEGLLGEEDGPIDWIAVEPSGRLWVVLVDGGDGAGGDQRLLVRGLAQRAWVRSRLPDWRQLARELPATRDTPPLLVLLAPEFSRLARVAAREADRDGIRLGRYRWQPGARGSAELRLEQVAPLDGRERSVASYPPSRPIASMFHSGLTDRDFESNGGPSLPRYPEGSDKFQPTDDNS